MSDDHFQTVQETEKTNYVKKLAAPLAFAGVCGAAALLFAGSNTASPSSTELISQSFLSATTGVVESCATNWERLWAENHPNFIGSAGMEKHVMGGQYWDPTFPADDSSLFWKMQTGDDAAPQVESYETVVGEAKGIKWVRPTELAEVSKKTKNQPDASKLREKKNYGLNPGFSKPSLFGPHGVQVRTSKQGNLGDCWLLASAAAVAQVPSRIEKVFNGITEYNENGAFQMNLFERGDPVYVHIDDRIPFTWYGENPKSDYSFINNKVSHDGAWWLVLLEKAMAKLNVNYSNLNSGRPGQALRVLTNAPVHAYSAATMKKWTDDQLWNIITEGMNKKYAMVAGTWSEPAFDVAPGHAETCLGTLILKNDDGSEHVKLIKMRNPWGNYEYDGPWSSKSDLWTPAFKKQAGFATANDGIFLMPLSDWKKSFQNLAIAHTQPWHEAHIEGTESVFAFAAEKVEWFTFYNPQEQDVMVECIQYTTRLWPNTDPNVCENSTDYPIGYSAYIYKGRDNIYDGMCFGGVCWPDNSILCQGGTMKLDKLAKGYYNMEVDKFGISAKGHGSFKLRSFGEKATVTWEHRPKLTKDNQY